MLTPGVIDELKKIVGKGDVLTSPEELVCYSYDATPFTHLPQAVVLPESTQEVSAILKLANREKFPVTPRGASSNLSGGAVPVQGGVVMLMVRFNRILEIDEENLTATVEPGVVLAQFHQAVEARGLFYPPDPASLSISTLGGNIGEGSGGPRCFKYGTTKDYVLGLEVVLPNGEVIWTGSKTVKNVSGYDLTHLFVGSEGTLGVVTKIIVKLIPLPEAKMTLLAIYDRIDDAARTVSSIVARRIIPTTLEMLDRATMELVEAYKPVGLPLDAEAVLLLEIDGSEPEVKRQASLAEEACRNCKAREVRVAKSKEESEQLWSARRSALAAVARGCVTMVIEDATVPRSAVPQFVRIIGELARKHHLRVPLLAHAGDGNMHPMVMTDFRDQEEMARVDAFADELFRAALDLGGTLSGEHGIGTLKAKYLAWQFGPAGVAAMHAIKRALDPNNILNPGKIFANDRDGV